MKIATTVSADRLWFAVEAWDQMIAFFAACLLVMYLPVVANPMTVAAGLAVTASVTSSAAALAVTEMVELGSATCSVAFAAELLPYFVVANGQVADLFVSWSYHGPFAAVGNQKDSPDRLIVADACSGGYSADQLTVVDACLEGYFAD